MEHPERVKWEEFSSSLQLLGLDLQTGFGPSKHQLLAFLEQKGLDSLIKQVND
jgi:hypothetical protein